MQYNEIQQQAGNLPQERAKVDSQQDTSQENQDNGNPVWEEISPLIWRDSIYSEEAKDSCMGKLFKEEVALFQKVLVDVKKDYNKVAIVEVGMGTAELFSKVVDDYDMLVGVEISQ